MSIVANIDNMMAATVTKQDIGGEISNNPIYFDKQQKSWRGDLQEIDDWKKDKNMGPIDWIAGIFMLIFHRVLKTFYVCGFFYFCPFLVILMINLLRQSNPKYIE